MRPSSLAALLFAPCLLQAQARTPDFTRPAWTSPVEFTYLSSIRELKDGRLIVTDPGERQIKLLGPDGRLLGTIGRTGGGPQEFAVPLQAFALPGDSTLIHDRDQHRFLLIGPDASPIGTIPWPRVNGDGLQGRVTDDGAGALFFADGQWGGAQRNAPLVRWRIRTGAIDTVATIQLVPIVQYKATVEGREADVSRMQPYGEEDSWVAMSTGAVAIVHPVSYQVDWRSPTGTITSAPAIKYTPVPVTDADRVDYLGGESQAARSQLTFPATKPAIISFHTIVSPNGEVWVRRYLPSTAKTTAWDVIDGRGRVVRSVVFPGHRIVTGFGRSTVFVAATDDDGIMHLEAYR